jgi:hypothetical protein
MNTSLSQNRDYRLITFYPTYENVHALLAEIHLYVFGADGKLIDSQAVRRDRATVAVAAEELRGAKVVIAPTLENAPGEPVTLASALSHYGFEAELEFGEIQSNYELPPVPEVVWRWWLVHSLWKSVHKGSEKKTRLLGW